MANILHKIRAYLYDNVLTTDNLNDFIARTASERSLNVKQVCTAAVNRGGSDVSAPSMEHAVELFWKKWHTSCVTVIRSTPGISQRERRFVGCLIVRMRPLIQKAYHFISVQPRRKTACWNSHHWNRYCGRGWQFSNYFIGDRCKERFSKRFGYSGTKFKNIGKQDKSGRRTPEQWYLFLNALTLERTSVEKSDWVVNNPSELILLVPDLAPGNYKLEVVTQYAVGSLLKEPRMAVYDKLLVVL